MVETSKPADSPGIDNLITAEARGDLSNLKGTDYHLLYTLWLIITNQVKSVHFFQGNDLLAKPMPPPHPDSEDSLSTAVVASTSDDLDSWIQLKCTTTPWTCSELFNENLLANFICNSFLSESKSHSWRVALVTTSDIRKNDILKFADNPTAFRVLNKKLKKITKGVAKKLAGFSSKAPITVELVTKRATEILTALAEYEPLSRRTINAEIIKELAFRICDRKLTYEVQLQLMGALLQDAAGGPDKAHIYDKCWLEDVTGHDLWNTLPLDESIAYACNEQVSKRLPDRFSVDEYTSRSVAERLIEEFLKSSATAFILNGRTGTGKSWTLAYWAHKIASARARLFIPGHLLNERSSLVQLIANELRSLTVSTQEDHVLFQRLVRPSYSNTFGPLVIAIDDVRPFFGRHTEYAQNLASLIDEARNYKIKIMLACQDDVMRNLRPFSQLRPADIFQPEHSIKSHDVDSNESTTSCLLEDFTNSELKQELVRRFGLEKADQILLRLSDPAFAPFRNPYILNIFLSESEDNISKALENLPIHYVASLFDQHINSLLKKTSDICCIGISECQRVLLFVASNLWQYHDKGVSHTELYGKVESTFKSVGIKVLDAFQTTGIISFAPKARFSDAKIGTRLFAGHLYEQFPTCEQLQLQLHVERDHEVVVQLCTLVSDPVKLASQMVDSDFRWIPAFSAGLAWCKPEDRRIGATLVAFARRESDGWSAAECLGRFALGSPSEWKELVQRFVSIHDEDQLIAERALYHVGKLCPERVMKAIRLRFQIRGDSPNDRKDRTEWRRNLARALRTVAGIDSEYAGSHVLRLLKTIEKVATEILNIDMVDDRLKLIRTDPLLEEYDQVRILASVYSDTQAFNQFLYDLTSPDDIIRARAVNALELIGRVLPERVQSEISNVIQTEQNASLLARILWSSFRIAERDPEMVLAAVESNASACWQSYESSAATLIILESLARRFPKRVHAILPLSWNNFNQECHLLLCEFSLLCRFCCRQGVSATRSEISPEVVDDEGSESIEPFNILYQLRIEILTKILHIGEEIGLTDSPRTWRFELRNEGQDFFMINISSWIKGKGNLFAKHPLCQEILQKIITAVQSAHDNQADVLDKWRGNVRYFLVRDCLDVLVSIVACFEHPETCIAELPRDWEVLYVTRKLFEMGASNEELSNLAIQECESRQKSATANASHQRNECLIALQKIAPDRVPQIHQERNGLSWFWSGGHSAGTRLVAQIDETPVKMLELLESTISSPTDAILLLDWNNEATKWSTLLFSRGFSRLFLLKKIFPSEAIELCNSMLLALESVPENPIMLEYRDLYTTILQLLKGNTAKPPSIRDDSNPIVQSHRLANEIISILINKITEADIRRFFFDKRGWWEDYNYLWKDDGKIQHGGGVGYYLLVFFPAVRLALCALGQACKWDDPGFSWTIERRRATVLSQDIGFTLQYPSLDRTRPIQIIEEAIRELPDQEMLYSVYGHLLLLDGKLDRAQEALEKALASPLCEARERGGVLYNLACLFARKGIDEQCRLNLLKAKELGCLDVDHAWKDSDLESVRDTTWFEELLRPN